MPQTVRVILFISILGYFGASQAQDTGPRFWSLYKGSTYSFGNAVQQKPLPSKGLRLFVWNIHKAEDSRITADFGDLSLNADVALFQESVTNKSFIDSLMAAGPEFGWTMTKSFQQLDLSYTGVATAARVKPLDEEVLVSSVTEPITETSKTILLSEFTIENSPETLLVANVHGINFVLTETYKIQIRQLLQSLRAHQGPLIVAGDFNTWSAARLTYLQKVFAPLGLAQVIKPSAGFLDLDHIFLRGLKARSVFDLSYIDSSDHAPLMVDLIYKAQAEEN